VNETRLVSEALMTTEQVMSTSVVFQMENSRWRRD